MHVLYFCNVFQHTVTGLKPNTFYKVRVCMYDVITTQELLTEVIDVQTSELYY